MTLLVSARRYRQPDPQFRRAGADRSAGPRQRSRRGLCLRQQAAGADPPYHRRRRCAHPAVGRAADARCQHRPHARAIHRRDRGRRDQQPGRQPGEFQPGGAHLLAQREERRHLSDRAADAAIPDRHAAGAAESADQRHRRADHGARRHRRHPPHPQRRRGLAVRHRPDGGDLRDDPGARSRRGLERHPEDHRPERQGQAEGRDRRPGRPDGDHEQRLLGPAVRPAGRHRAGLFR